MKILYGIQGTGNGHMSRARAILPELKRHGEVDVAVSSNQVEQKINHPIKYHFEGLGFTFGKGGGIDFRASAGKAHPVRLLRDIKACPVEQYDLVINDFEPVTAWAAKQKGVPCVALSHQYAFRSESTPRPVRRDRIGEAVLKHYAPTQSGVGFHFAPYDSFVRTPIIRQEVREIAPTNAGHICVYLPSYDDQYLAKLFSNVKGTQFDVFSKHARMPYDHENVHVEPIRDAEWLKSLGSCDGALMGGGFEGPSEALYLGKKLLVVPMSNQYEQQCNAAALMEFGVPILTTINKASLLEIKEWKSKEEGE